MHIETHHWVYFHLFIIFMLALDLGVFHRKHHAISFKEAIGWSVVWISLALAFNGWIYKAWGSKPAMEFLAAYLIEKSLSVDNIFVFLVIFGYFKVPARYQHEVLFWGILGALFMRAGFILAGVTLLHHFHWLMYVFGAVLIVTGVKLWNEKGKEMHPDKNTIVRFFRKLMPVTNEYHDGKFVTKINGRATATPLLVTLLVVETTDVIFAVDSIPAVLALTRDPFIAYTSNIFAILGLRSLYFALAGVMNLFHLLHYGLAMILVFVGTKMLIVDIYKVPIGISLGVVFGILAASVAISVMNPEKPKHS